MASKTLKTYVALILDKSGSMQDIRKEAVSHFNEQLQVIQEESNTPQNVAKSLLKNQKTQGLETRITLVTFNHNVDFHFFNESLDKVQPLKLKDYKPDGTTAMYDAMGKTIERFLSEIPDINKKNVSVLFAIITDGLENASQKFTQEKLRSQVKDLQDTGRWTFTYLGANQDVLEQAAQNLSMPVGNTFSFTATSAGMRDATVAHASGLHSYYDSRRAGAMAVSNFYDDADSAGDTQQHKDANYKKVHKQLEKLVEDTQDMVDNLKDD